MHYVEKLFIMVQFYVKNVVNNQVPVVYVMYLYVDFMFGVKVVHMVVILNICLNGFVQIFYVRLVVVIIVKCVNLSVCVCVFIIVLFVFVLSSYRKKKFSATNQVNSNHYQHLPSILKPNFNLTFS